MGYSGSDDSSGDSRDRSDAIADAEARLHDLDGDESGIEDRVGVQHDDDTLLLLLL